MSLSMDDLDHAARLGHLMIPEEKKTAILGQLTQILDYMDQLDDLDLSNVAPSAHATDLGTQLRDDVVQAPVDLNLSANAPDWDEDAFSVPKILA